MPLVGTGYAGKGKPMPRISAGRRITLPVDQCREVGLKPGGEYRSFVADGRITIVPMAADAARGMLKHIAGDSAVSEDESLEDALDESWAH